MFSLFGKVGLSKVTQTVYSPIYLHSDKLVCSNESILSQTRSSNPYKFILSALAMSVVQSGKSECIVGWSTGWEMKGVNTLSCFKDHICLTMALRYDVVSLYSFYCMLKMFLSFFKMKH